jgi:hypothetical protein
MMWHQPATIIYLHNIVKSPTIEQATAEDILSLKDVDYLVD